MLASVGAYAISAPLTPIYRATATLITTGQPVDPALARLLPQDAPWPGFFDRSSTPAGVLLASSPVRRAIELRTARRLAIDPSTIHAAVTVTDSNERRVFPRYAQTFRTISFEAAAPKARVAARIANQYAREYVTYHRQLVDERIAAAETHSSIRMAASRSSGGAFGSDRHLRRLTQRRELMRAAAALELMRFTTATPARIPDRPANPGPLRNGLLAGLLVIAAGCLIAVVRTGRHQ